MSTLNHRIQPISCSKPLRSARRGAQGIRALERGRVPRARRHVGDLPAGLGGETQRSGFSPWQIPWDSQKMRGFYHVLPTKMEDLHEIT